MVESWSSVFDVSSALFDEMIDELVRHGGTAEFKLGCASAVRSAFQRDFGLQLRRRFDELSDDTIGEMNRARVRLQRVDQALKPDASVHRILRRLQTKLDLELAYHALDRYRGESFELMTRLSELPCRPIPPPLAGELKVFRGRQGPYSKLCKVFKQDLIGDGVEWYAEVEAPMLNVLQQQHRLR